MRQRIGTIVMGLALGACLMAPPVEAGVTNLGADVYWHPAFTEVPFFNGNDDGYRIYGGDSLTVTLNAAAVFGAYDFNGATLFVDAFSFDAGDAGDVSVQGVSVGGLSHTDWPATYIPLASGGAVVSPTWDVDNNFFALSLAQIADLSTDGTYTVTFRNLSEDRSVARSFRVDGLNIQAVHSPEPMSAMLFGLGGLGMLLPRRRNLLKSGTV